MSEKEKGKGVLPYGLTKDFIDGIVDGGRVIFNTVAGNTILLPYSDPCSYKPLPDSKWFYYDTNDKTEKPCKKTGLAAGYVRMWNNKDSEIVGDLTPADLNNIACAHLWQEKPDWEKAQELFTKASETSQPVDPTITDNINRVKMALDKIKIPVIIEANVHELLETLGVSAETIEELSTQEIDNLLDLRK